MRINFIKNEYVILEDFTDDVVSMWIIIQFSIISVGLGLLTCIAVA
jgi:hypothetical protein